MSKRLYLCNLIPLWNIDSGYLEADWAREEARHGEVVEARVLVTLPLRFDQPNLTARFEINESDYLLFGGLDDHIVTLGTVAAGGVEHRTLAILGENDPIPEELRLTRIFVRPAKGGGAATVSAFWKATFLEDVSGAPEFYFDVVISVDGTSYKERSTRELTVREGPAAVEGDGAELAGALALPLIGWTTEQEYPGHSVTRFALLQKEMLGHPVSFLIKPVQGDPLWIMLLPGPEPVHAAAVKIERPWVIPLSVALGGITSLRLSARVGGATHEARNVAAIPLHEGVALHRDLELRPGRPGRDPPPGMDAGERRLHAKDLLARAPQVALIPSLRTALTGFVSNSGSSTDPKSPDFAFGLQEFAYARVHKNDELLPRPTKASERAHWEGRFRETYVLALWILESGDHVADREGRAGIIAQDLATAGFLNEAISLGQLFMERAAQRSVYEMALEQLGAIPSSQLALVLRFFADESRSLANHALTAALGLRLGRIDGRERLLPGGTRQVVSRLGSTDVARDSRLRSIFEHVIAEFESDPDIVHVLASLLFFQRTARHRFAEQLWNDRKEYLLFKVLSADEFIEPDYGAPTLDGVQLTMRQDMPWVYANKQRYFVDVVGQLGLRGDAAIPRPADLGFEALRSWLEDQTDAIGRVLPVVYPDQPEAWTWFYERLADIFFFHIDRGNVTPDLSGHIGGLRPADPDGMRLRADCDVFATYGARFLRNCGFVTVGYLGAWGVTNGNRLGVGHAGVLLRLGDRYFELNNKEVGALDARDEASALRLLRDGVLDTLNDPPDHWIFYAPAAEAGAMPGALLQRAADLRRRDLER